MLKKILRTVSTSDHDFKEVLKHSFLAFLMLGVAGVMQIIFDLVLARHFGAHGVGVFYLAFSVIFMLSLIGRLGFNKAVVKYIPGFVRTKQWPELHGLKKTADRLTLLISILLGFITYLLATYIADKFFHKPETAQYIRWFAIMLPALSFMYVQTGFLNGLKRVKESVFIERASVNAFAIVFILIFGNMLGLNSAVIGTVIGTFVFAYAASFIIKRSIPNVSRTILFNKKTLLLLAAPLLFVDFSNQMTGQVNILILGSQVSASQVGIFNAVLRLSAVISVVLTGINTITTTKIAELHNKQEHDKLELLASKAAGLALLCGLPLILMLLISPQFFLGLFGSEFVAGSTALRILVIAQAVNLTCGSVVQILSMTGYHKEVAYGTVATALILDVVLSIVLVPIYGINGAAAAVAISVIVQNLVLLFMIKRYLNIWSLPFKAIGSWISSLR